jgi:hypothetical protein
LTLSRIGLGGTARRNRLTQFYRAIYSLTFSHNAHKQLKAF